MHGAPVHAPARTRICCCLRALVSSQPQPDLTERFRAQLQMLMVYRTLPSPPLVVRRRARVNRAGRERYGQCALVAVLWYLRPLSVCRLPAVRHHKRDGLRS